MLRKRTKCRLCQKLSKITSKWRKREGCRDSGRATRDKWHAHLIFPRRNWVYLKGGIKSMFFPAKSQNDKLNYRQLFFFFSLAHTLYCNTRRYDLIMLIIHHLGIGVFYLHFWEIIQAHFHQIYKNHLALSVRLSVLWPAILCKQNKASFGHCNKTTKRLSNSIQFDSIQTKIPFVFDMPPT